MTTMTRDTFIDSYRPGSKLLFSLSRYGKGLKEVFLVKDHTLNKALKALRYFYRYSQSDLAKKLDVPKSYISDIERGKKSATLLLVGKYSKAFGIPSSEILALSEAYDRCNFKKSRSSTILKIVEWIMSDGDANGGARLKGVALEDGNEKPVGGDGSSATDPTEKFRGSMGKIDSNEVLF